MEKETNVAGWTTWITAKAAAKDMQKQKDSVAAL